MGSCISRQESEHVALQTGLQAATYKSTKPFVPDFTYAKVVKVIDGDTVWIAAYQNGKLNRWSARIYGIDTMELKSNDIVNKQKAMQARQYVTDLIFDKIVDVQILTGTFDTQHRRTIWDKNGRLIVNISYQGLDLASELIKLKLAYPYYGGTKQKRLE